MNIKDNLLITVLGSGASTGVPIVSCECAVCTSNNPFNKRTRTSLFIEDKKFKQNILIDASTDLRFQLLSQNITTVDHVLFTHTHADHCHGIDDLRPLFFFRKKPIHIWATGDHLKDLKQRFAYLFYKTSYSGTVPHIIVHELKETEFYLGKRRVFYYPLPHGHMNSNAFLFDNFLYATDFHRFPDEYIVKMRDKVDIMIASGLRMQEHPTHFSIPQTLDLFNKLQIQSGFMTHLSHSVDYESTNKSLPNKFKLAYDGLSFKL